MNDHIRRKGRARWFTYVNIMCTAVFIFVYIARLIITLANCARISPARYFVVLVSQKELVLFRNLHVARLAVQDD